MEGLADLIIGYVAQPRVYGLFIYVTILVIALQLTDDVYIKFKRRKSGFGTVFNSVTGKPVDLARVRLVDVHGLTVTSAVTDKYGHYRLTVTPGEYTVDVTKPGFVFPSVFLKNHKHSKTYVNVLPTHRIKIKDHGIITVNIPIDPVEGMRKRSRVFRKWMVLSDNVQLVIAYASPIVFMAYPLINPARILPWLAYGVYVSLILYRLTHFTPGKPPYGTITDLKSGKPIPKVVIRLFDAKFNKLLTTQITSDKGRYALLVNRGAYYMTMKADGYKQVRLNFPHITKDSYPLATDVKMKQVD
ncbi:hypothetical protein GF380_02450 [Candidatus Uhrbacteria bacterium]|nr:hypothetical protein [Candidatus Uhrbacteria bacterium]MBD3284052.1 hypothetical protein [Candidatus Uhrbacteria bacterium]